jgi:ribosomal protein S18 acetylase RimI-like enzyme
MELSSSITIRMLTAEDVRGHLRGLAGVLLDCVEGGASVSFMADLSQAEAEAYFEDVAREVYRENRRLWSAFDGQRLVGTVQLILATPPNQPHRGEVAKMLVRTDARGRGVARRLMEALLDEAATLGRTLITLDTATGSAAEHLYRSLDFVEAGTIPGYALYPDGRPCATTYYYREIR